MTLRTRIEGMHPLAKKLIGVILVILGFLALITPLTPGSWLALIGFELLGLRFLFLDKLKALFKKKEDKNRP